MICSQCYLDPLTIMITLLTALLSDHLDGEDFEDYPKHHVDHPDYSYIYHDSPYDHTYQPKTIMVIWHPILNSII